MKKQLITATVALVSAGALAACNTDSNGAEEIQQLLEESNEAMAALDSYAMETQALTPEDEEGQEMSSIVQLTRDPLSFEVSQTGPNPMTGEVEEMKEYFSDGLYYTEEPTVGGWIYMDGEEAGMTGGADLRPAEVQTEYLIEHASSLTLEETDEFYVFTAEGTEDESGALALTLAGDSEGESGLKVNEFSYQLQIDKETMLQQDVEMTIGLAMQEEGMESVQQMMTTYSQFNEVEERTVPEEIADEAISMDEAIQQFEEEQAESEEQPEVDEEEQETDEEQPAEDEEE